MLRLTIDLIPLGNEKQKKTLSVLEIENKAEVSECGGSIYSYCGYVIPHGTQEKQTLMGYVSNGQGNTVLSLIQKILGNILS